VVSEKNLDDNETTELDSAGCRYEEIVAASLLP
jgi:hypothetical protein